MVRERERDRMLGDTRGRKTSQRRRCSAESPGKIVGFGTPLLALGRLGATREGTDGGGVRSGVEWKEREPGQLFSFF